MLARVLVIGAFLLVALVIYALVDAAVTPASAIRGLPKPLWIVVIVVFLPVGAVLWFLLGKTRARGSASNSKPAPPPDIVDRPSTTGPFSTESSEDRIARLEEELRRLDDEGDMPTKGSE
jgi:hypothetical protein